MKFRCRDCKNHQTHLYGSVKMIYCPLRRYYPSPMFIEAWGCGEYEPEQLSLFDERGGEVYDHIINYQKS